MEFPAAAVTDPHCLLLSTSPPPEPSLQPGAREPSAPIEHLPEDSLHQIFSHLPLRQILACRSVCRLFRNALSSPSFLSVLPPLPLLALRHPRHHHAAAAAAAAAPPLLHALDPSLDQWLRFPLSFLPFPFFSPVTASPSLLYLWADTDPSKQTKSLVLCNPLTQSYRVLPQLGSAWSRHGTVLAGAAGYVLVLTELAAILYSPTGDSSWLKFSLNLPSKPRSPILVEDCAYTICDVGSPWRSQWKLFACPLRELGGRGWERLERHEWGDVFDILKRPRLVRGRGNGRILMIGGLRSSFVVDAPCSTVLILRLDLGKMEWDEAGRMPLEMYQCFGGTGAPGGGNNKVKVFGGYGTVWFSGKKVRGKLAMWEEEEEGKGGGGVWRWVDGVPGYGDGVYRGFVFTAAPSAVP